MKDTQVRCECGAQPWCCGKQLAERPEELLALREEDIDAARELILVHNARHRPESDRTSQVC